MRLEEEGGSLRQLGCLRERTDEARRSSCKERADEEEGGVRTARARVTVRKLPDRGLPGPHPIYLFCREEGPGSSSFPDCRK